MGSFLMHIGVSEVVRQRLKLSSKFIYGSILPDLIKLETGDRNSTHFIKTIVKGDVVKRLPMVDDAIEKLKDKFDKEIRLGYIAHLVEDLIWFEKYIPSIAEHIDDGKMVYLKDKSIHLSEEFSKDIYEDYTKINSYIADKYCRDYEKLKKELAKQMSEKELATLETNVEMLGIQAIDTTHIITKEKLDMYMRETEEKVEKIIKELLGE